MDNKGQAALEFLTTYGWAMLVILLMVGTIAYFGILDTDKITPNRCIISPEFNCQDYAIENDGTVSIMLQQSMGKTIYLTALNCTYNNGVADEAVITGLGAGNAWSPRNSIQASCNLPAIGGLKGNKIKVSYTMQYRTSASGLYHTSEGEVYAEVQ